MAEPEWTAAAKTQVDGLPDEPDSASVGRAAKRAPHPAWRIAWSLLTMLLMAGASYGLFRLLLHVAGPPSTAPVREFDPDPTGYASIFSGRVQPGEGEVLLITWTALNLGAKEWSVATHHWEPLDPSLPPLPLPRAIASGDSAYMAVRLEPPFPAVVGWRLMGIKGPVQEGKIELTISR